MVTEEFAKLSYLFVINFICDGSTCFVVRKYLSYRADLLVISMGKLLHVGRFTRHRVIISLSIKVVL